MSHKSTQFVKIILFSAVYPLEAMQVLELIENVLAFLNVSLRNRIFCSTMVV